ncbi:threonine/serine exporter family protein [Helicobacter muridarum]|uniref:Inner membrane protein YjjP n=3 Tax=Helicobacter muridarum TaxID=216 RepID=A0A377PTU9_9HELI|nr:threonine/serine exporter family protein [Helicobacter muridarum]STQ86368.1 Inner membrane protein YjjP [Helicobacter muridarum]
MKSDKAMDLDSNLSKPIRKTKADIEELVDFLALYATALLANGAYTSRIVRCTSRIGHSFGYDVNMIIWLKYISINVTDKNNYDNRRTRVTTNSLLSMNLRIISDLSALSWQIHDNRITLKEANIRFQHILSIKNYGFIPTLLSACIANTTLCKLFNGDVGALLCVFVGTLIGFSLRFILTKFKVDIRGILVIVSFASSFSAYTGVYLGITATPEIAIGCSILYLIPGMQIINSLVDILHEYTLMAVSRGINMCVWLICIAIGVYITLDISKMSIINV